MTLARRAAAEAIGTTLLLAIVVGSGIMGERLAGGNAAISLFANSVATGAGLYALIVMFGAISGAHFNPVISVVSAIGGELRPRDCAVYLTCQICGAVAGVVLAHAMFGLPIVQISTHLRPTIGEALGEIIATAGLVFVIVLVGRSRPSAVPATVAAFITSAYWFTSSTSFANPAVTIARAATDTFSGIAPENVPLFIAAQAAGAILAVPGARWLMRKDGSMISC